MERATEINQYCTFNLGELFFGIDVRRVQEVIRYHELTPAPLAPPVIAGLINLRGDIVTAINLRDRLEIKGVPAVDPETQMNIVIRTEENLVSLIVDRIGDILMLDPKDFERPPETLQGVARQLIIGAYKLKSRLLLILDIDQVIDVQSAAEKR